MATLAIHLVEVDVPDVTEVLSDYVAVRQFLSGRVVYVEHSLDRGTVHLLAPLYSKRRRRRSRHFPTFCDIFTW